MSIENMTKSSDFGLCISMAFKGMSYIVDYLANINSKKMLLHKSKYLDCIDISCNFAATKLKQKSQLTKCEYEKVYFTLSFLPDAGSYGLYERGKGWVSGCSGSGRSYSV